MSTGLWIVLCVLLFFAGEVAMLFIIALLSANKEANNGDKRKEKR